MSRVYLTLCIRLKAQHGVDRWLNNTGSIDDRAQRMLDLHKKNFRGGGLSREEYAEFNEIEDYFFEEECKFEDAEAAHG